MYKILMVCTGNICRSPTAHGFLHNALEENGLNHIVSVDSAGTTAYHIGEAPDPRTQKAALKHDIDLSSLCSRQIKESDYDEFDLLLAMDQSHLNKMKAQAPENTHHKILLYLDFTDLPKGSEVPDPYYGGEDGFHLVTDLAKAATTGLIHVLKSQLA